MTTLNLEYTLDSGELTWMHALVGRLEGNNNVVLMDIAWVDNLCKRYKQ